MIYHTFCKLAFNLDYDIYDISELAVKNYVDKVINVGDYTEHCIRDLIQMFFLDYNDSNYENIWVFLDKELEKLNEERE